MGRGRAKAKQAKIARELKYFSPPTDLTALQLELAGGPRGADDERDAGVGTGEREDSAAR